MSEKKGRKKVGETKRCPYCSAPVPVHAEECFSCNEKIGTLGKYGLAKKPFDWKGYLICLIMLAAFGWYIWWAFF